MQCKLRELLHRSYKCHHLTQRQVLVLVHDNRGNNELLEHTLPVLIDRQVGLAMGLLHEIAQHIRRAAAAHDELVNQHCHGPVDNSRVVQLL